MDVQKFKIEGAASPNPRAFLTNIIQHCRPLWRNLRLSNALAALNSEAICFAESLSFGIMFR
jgi:hypothetical protein